jgi:hypothetical protein
MVPISTIHQNSAHLSVNPNLEEVCASNNRRQQILEGRMASQLVPRICPCKSSRRSGRKTRRLFHKEFEAIREILSRYLLWG